MNIHALPAAMALLAGTAGHAQPAMHEGQPARKPQQSAQVQPDDRRVGITATPAVLGPFLPVSHGDVHIRTTDGLRYDFQATGDYLLIQSTDGHVVVQSRQQMTDENPNVSVNTAGAIRMMGDTLLWHPRKQALYVNGELTPIPTSRTTLPGGGVIEPLRKGDRELLVFHWPDQSFVVRMVSYANHTIDFEVKQVVSSHRTFEGLIGNMDGSRQNDLQLRGGENPGTSPSNDAITRVGESWRVRADENLFHLPHPDPIGESARDQLGIVDLDPIARQFADQYCRSDGVVDATALRNCIYDMAATGDGTFVESARQFQETVAALSAAERAGEAVEPVHIQVPTAVAPTDEGPGMFLGDGQIQRGSRYAMNDHYLTFQEDGNLCVYTTGHQRIWCIGNDPGVRYQHSATVALTADGRLRVADAHGDVVWQAPASDPQPRTGLYLTAEGALQLRVPSGQVMWSSR